MTVYSARQVYDTINSVYRQNKGKDIPYEAGIIYTAIVLKESGGNSSALNANDSGSPSRGWWQIREVNHPTVSAAMAFDPLQSTQYAYKISNGFSIDGVDPWIGPGRKTIQDEFSTNENRRQALATAVATVPQPTGVGSGGGGGSSGGWGSGDPWWKKVIDNIPLNPLDPISGPSIGDAVDAGGSVVDAVTSPLNAVGELIGIITNPEFWKRVGLAALGLLVVLIAIAFYLARNSPVGGMINE